MGNLITLQNCWYSTRSEPVRICFSIAAFCALALLFLCAVGWPERAAAQACTSYPYTLTNGTVADANQVMTNFNAINNAINACAAPLYNPVFTGGITLNNSNNSAITFRDGDLTPRTHSFFVTNTDANGGMLAGITNYPGPGTDVNLNGLYIMPSYAGNWDQWVPTISVIGQSANGAGLVGIGTTSPSRALHVYSTNGLAFKAENNGTGDAVVEIQSDNNAETSVNFNDSTGGTYGQIAYVQGAGNNYMMFRTNTAERLRIDSSGNVGIGTTSPSYPLQVNGNAFANSWQTPSDARLKKNIAPISGALDTIQHLQGVRFEWRNAGERLIGKSLDLPINKPQIGFIAQDVRSVLPEAITVAAGPEALMSIQESKIVPVLVEAVKELKAANDSEAKEIEALKADIAEIKRERGIHTATN